MNIWAFLFYTLLISNFSILAERYDGNEKGKDYIALIFWFAVIFLFIYMGWYQ